ncbi:hypothetical protein D3C87_1497680 [compost metagenome]
MRLYRTGLAVDDDDVVVFLQCERDLAIGIDRDEFRLRIFRGDFGKAGHVDLLQRRAVSNAVFQTDRHQITGGHLWQGAFVHLLIAFVLDRDGGEGLVRGNCDRIWLAAEIAARFDLLGGDIDRHQLSGRLGAVFGRVDTGQNLGASNGNRGRFAFQQQRAASLGCLGVGDVNESNAAKRAVRIDQRLTVFAGGYDFS